jgi:hypothetical protein
MCCEGCVVSDPVWVTEEEPGRWSALCCDDRCGGGLHAVLVTSHEPAAKAAATRHRKLLAALPPAKAREPRKDECPGCGQSPSTIRELRELVEALEIELSRVLG